MLVLPIPPILISHGPADGASALTVAVPLPPLPPWMGAFAVYAHAAAVSAVVRSASAFGARLCKPPAMHPDEDFHEAP
jgi:hypothetical protein